MDRLFRAYRNTVVKNGAKKGHQQKLIRIVGVENTIHETKRLPGRNSTTRGNKGEAPQLKNTKTNKKETRAWIRFRQQRRNGKKNSGNCQRRSPLLFQYVQTDASVLVNLMPATTVVSKRKKAWAARHPSELKLQSYIGVINFCLKRYLLKVVEWATRISGELEATHPNQYLFRCRTFGGLNG